MMDHSEIEERDVLERYVQRRLGGDEELAFEAHLLECQDCYDAVRWADDMGDAIKAAAAQEILATQARASVLARLAGRRSAGWLLVLLLVAAPTALYLRENARLREVLAPQVNTPVFTLGAVRDGSRSRVSLGASPEWIVLTMTLPSVEHASYRATLTDTDGNVVWQGDGLVPDASDRLVVSLYSTLLEPGDYDLAATGPDGESDAETFRFTVTR